MIFKACTYLSTTKTWKWKLLHLVVYLWVARISKILPFSSHWWLTLVISAIKLREIIGPKSCWSLTFKRCWVISSFGHWLGTSYATSHGSTSYQELCFAQVPIHGMCKRHREYHSTWGKRSPADAALIFCPRSSMRVEDIYGWRGSEVHMVQPPQELKRATLVSWTPFSFEMSWSIQYLW